MTQQAKKRSKQSCSELIANVLFKRMGWGGVGWGAIGYRESLIIIFAALCIFDMCLCCCLTCTPAKGTVGNKTLNLNNRKIN